MIIYWNRRPLLAHAGDTIAMTLWRHGIGVLGYSRKRHRPLGAGGHVVQGCLVTVNGIPNRHADHVQVTPGMVVSRQGAWPSPYLDLLRLLPFLPARWSRSGFERPYWLRSGTRRFEWWEQLLMQVAGAAQAPTQRLPCPPGHRWDGELVVIGGGPAGIRAANAAAAQGQRVCLVTRSPQPGAFASALGHPPPPVHPTVHVLCAHEAVGVYRHGTVVLAAPREPAAASVLVTQRLILATGVESLGPLLPGRDLPGVFEPRTALRWAQALGPAFGPTVVVGTGRESQLADALRGFGVDVRRVCGQQDVTFIEGRTAVRAVRIGAERVRCRSVVHAGPWITNSGLAFQAAAAGVERLMAKSRPAHVAVIGAAADALPAETGIIDGIASSVSVCACMDVTVADIDDCLAQGECHIEEIKRTTACGMGPCQGFPCWSVLRALLTHRTGAALDDLPTSRPPARGITVAQAAGLDGLLELE